MALAGWVGLVVASTLSPIGLTRPFTLRTFLCIGCGAGDTADIILNWALFVPGGVLLAMALDMRRTVVATICLTASIETLQIGIPGRDPALQDLVFNSLGALSGALLLKRGLGRSGRHALVAIASVGWFAPLALLLPIAPDSDLYGLWTPVFGGVERYEGRVLDARVGDVAVGSSLVGDQAGLRAAVVARRAIDLSIEVGPRPSTFAPIFEIGSADEVEVTTIGALGDDLLLLWDQPSRLLGLRPLPARWPGAMAGLAVGDTVRMTIDRRRDSGCASIGSKSRCRIAPSLRDGWGLLLNLRGVPRWLATVLSVVWPLALGVAVGAASPTMRSGVITGMMGATAGWVACAALSPDVRPDLTAAALFGMASLLGAALHRVRPAGSSPVGASGPRSGDEAMPPA